jgi:hypothetical protein
MSADAAGASETAGVSGTDAAGSWCQRSVAWSCSRVIWRAVNMNDEAARGGLTIQLYQQDGFGCSEETEPGFRRDAD